MRRGWQTLPLADRSVSLNRKRVPITKKHRISGPYPYYGASGVVDSVSDYIFEGLHLLIAEDGENLRSRNSPVAFLADGRFWVNNHAHVLQANKDNDLRFLAYAVEHTDIAGFVTGSAQPKLSQGALQQLPIMAPPLNEQRGIAATLGALDDKIDSNRRVSSLATATANSLYLQSADKQRVRASDLLKPVLGGTPKRAVAEYWSGRIPWASAKDVAASDGSYIVRTEETISHSGVRNSAAKVLPAETVVMTARGTVGALALLSAPMAFNQSCYALTSREDVSSRVLFLALREAIERIQDAGHGSVFNTVNMATFDQIELDWPSLSHPTIQQIERYFDLTLQKLRESQKLEALRDALLPELLSGRIRVPEAAEAVASA